ncbi:AraC family transcriptional regulator [Scytonema tolypothrichoides VB-61278]|nr:AraC family transcriptional regulator [Scytonema tolypothrichoides VB-61278]
MSSNYREFQPSARLASMIECFWMLEAVEDNYQSVLPDGCTDLLLRFTQEEQYFDIIGAMTQPQRVQVVAGAAFVGIRFKPGMAYSILPVHGATLTDKTVPLRSLWQGDANSLTKQLIHAENGEEQVHALEKALEMIHPPSAAQRAIDTLVEQNGQMSLDELCDIAEMGERQFRRLCLERTGLAPKLLARILRFRRVTRLLDDNNAMSMAVLAAECGYFDQAHMIHDFQVFAGTSPTRYLARFS